MVLWQLQFQNNDFCSLLLMAKRKKQLNNTKKDRNKKKCSFIDGMKCSQFTCHWKVKQKPLLHWVTIQLQWSLSMLVKIDKRVMVPRNHLQSSKKKVSISYKEVNSVGVTLQKRSRIVTIYIQFYCSFLIEASLQRIT